MYHKVMTMGLCATLAFGMTGLAQKKDAKKAPQKASKMESKMEGKENPLHEAMESMPKPFQSLKKNLDAKNAADSIKDAQTLADLFKATDPVWAKAKFADAEKASKENQAAANDIISAVKANKFDDAASAYSTLAKSCTGCHNVHREKLPDGKYRMK